MKSDQISVSETRCLWKSGLFKNVHFLEALENLEILEILVISLRVENKGESDHVLENLGSLDVVEILETKDPFPNDPFSRSRSGGG